MKHMISMSFIDPVKKGAPVSDQRGYVLLTGLLALCLLSLLGIWALSTSEFEVQIASNKQQLEQNFSIAEGAAKREGAAVGFARSGACNWYEITDPGTFNQFLTPPTAAYDPGGDMEIDGTFPEDFNRSDYRTWPCQNLRGDIADDANDYSYVSTYLYPDLPPKGYNATRFSGYLFRINGKKRVIVEIGGMKVGVKVGI